MNTIAHVCFSEIRLETEEDDVGTRLACYVLFARRKRAPASVSVLLIVVAAIVLIIFVTIAVLRIVVVVGSVSSMPPIMRVILGVVVLQIEY